MTAVLGRLCIHHLLNLASLGRLNSQILYTLLSRFENYGKIHITESDYEVYRTLRLNELSEISSHILFAPAMME